MLSSCVPSPRSPCGGGACLYSQSVTQGDRAERGLLLSLFSSRATGVPKNEDCMDRRPAKPPTSACSPYLCTSLEAQIFGEGRGPIRGYKYKVHVCI